MDLGSHLWYSSCSDFISSTHLPNTKRTRKIHPQTTKQEATSQIAGGDGGLRFWGVDFSCTFLLFRHFIELSRRHLQETATASGIPEPPPHPLSVLIRPLHVCNTPPPPPPPWHYTYSYGCAWQTMLIIYCKRGNTSDVSTVKCVTKAVGGESEDLLGLTRKVAVGSLKFDCVFLHWGMNGKMGVDMQVCLHVCMSVSVCIEMARGRCQQGKPQEYYPESIRD